MVLCTSRTCVCVKKEYHDVSVIRADNQHLDKESFILTPTSVTIL